MRSSTRLRCVPRLALACALAWGVGCKRAEDTTAPAARPASAAGVIVGDAEVVRVEHPAQMLPRDTQMIGWVAGIDRLAAVFERAALARSFPREFEEIGRELTEQFGYDLSDPSAYRALGIDPKARVGAAMISASGGVAAVFFRLSDEGKFKTALRDLLGRKGQELAERQVGPATVLSDPRGRAPGGLILRDGLAMLVIDAGRGEGPVNYVDVIARQDPRQSLAAAVEYRKALGGLRDTDAMGFVNVGVLLGDVVRDFVRNDDTQREESAEHWQQTLREAREREASPEEITRLEKSRDQELAWRTQWQRREEAQLQIFETLTDGIQGVGLALTMKRTGPVVDGQIVLADGAFVRRLVKANDKGLALPKALNGEPMLLWGGNVDVEAAFELVDLFAQGEGENLHDLSTELASKVLGINPITELKPLLTGEATVAVTLEAPINYARLEELPKQIGLTVHLGIRDPKRTEALLAKIDTSKTEAGKALTRQGGAYVFSVPDFRPMQAVVAGRHLLVTTDKGLAGRMVTGAEGSMRKDTHPAGPYHVMTLPKVAGAWLTDMRGTGLLFMTGSSMVSTRDAFMGPDDPPWEEVERSRMSRASKKKKAELDAAAQRLAVAQAAREAAQAKSMVEAMGALGATAFVVQPNARGLSISGGQFLGRNSVAEVVEVMLTLVLGRGIEADGTGTGTEVSEAREQHERARVEYGALRVADWERARKRGRGRNTSRGRSKKTGTPKAK